MKETLTRLSLVCALAACSKPQTNTPAAGDPAADAPSPSVAEAPIVLPRAEFFVPHDGEAVHPPTLDVLQNGTVLVDGKVRHVGGQGDTDALFRLLTDIRRDGLLGATLQLADAKLGDATVKVMAQPLRIRADKWTEWRAVRAILAQCARPEVAFWSVQLASADQDKETGERNAAILGSAPTGEEGLLSIYVGMTPARGQALTVTIEVEEAGIQDYSSFGGSGTNPKTGLPNRYQRKGRKLHWKVGALTIRSLPDLRAELTRLAADPKSMIPDSNSGGFQLMGCVIEAPADVCVADVVLTHDAARAAGFSRVPLYEPR